MFSMNDYSNKIIVQLKEDFDGATVELEIQVSGDAIDDLEEREQRRVAVNLRRLIKKSIKDMVDDEDVLESLLEKPKIRPKQKNKNRNNNRNTNNSNNTSTD
jgi:hypothetical protein